MIAGSEQDAAVEAAVLSARPGPGASTTPALDRPPPRGPRDRAQRHAHRQEPGVHERGGHPAARPLRPGDDRHGRRLADPRTRSPKDDRRQRRETGLLIPTARSPTAGGRDRECKPARRPRRSSVLDLGFTLRDSMRRHIIRMFEHIVVIGRVCGLTPRAAVQGWHGRGGAERAGARAGAWERPSGRRSPRSLVCEVVARSKRGHQAVEELGLTIVPGFPRCRRGSSCRRPRPPGRRGLSLLRRRGPPQLRAGRGRVSAPGAGGGSRRPVVSRAGARARRGVGVGLVARAGRHTERRAGP